MFNVSICQQFVKITLKIPDTEKSGLSSQLFWFVSKSDKSQCEFDSYPVCYIQE